MSNRPFSLVPPGYGPEPTPAQHSSLPQTVTRLATARTLQPGGELLGYLQTRALQFFERNYRSFAPEGAAQATPRKPTTFTLGAVQVPKSQVLVILDYSFNIFTFSGLAPGDYVPVEPNSLSTQVMWDINVDARHDQLNAQYQVIPQRSSVANQAFADRNPLATAVDWQFEQERAAQQQSTAAFGLAGMPQRHHRPGKVQVANQYIARGTETLKVECAIINPIPIPVAFFEADIAGFLVAQQVYDAYQAMNAPTGNPQVPVLLDQTTENR